MSDNVNLTELEIDEIQHIVHIICVNFEQMTSDNIVQAYNSINTHAYK